MKPTAGFSLIETVVALAIFTILISTGVFSYVPALISNRQGIENSRANQLAKEGLEAVRSIRDRSWNNLSSGTYGIGISSSLWSFVGTSDSINKYQRQVILSSANRDAGGSLVASGGVTDPDTYYVTSKVTWNFTPGSNNSYTISEYLSNWRKSIGANIGDALAIYSEGTSFPVVRFYANGTSTFGTETTLPFTANGRVYLSEASPLRNEAIVGYINSSGTLSVLCFNGSDWSLDWSVGVGGTGNTLRFDLAYENTSGDAIVLYSTNTATTNEMAYRVKPGGSSCGSSNWDAAVNYDPLRTTGVVHWVKMTPDRRASSNIIAAAWADSNSDLSASLWNGSSFVNEPTAVTEASLEVVAISQDIDDFDLDFESLSGDLLLVWANSAGSNAVNGVRYRLCTGGTASCTWGAVTTPPTFLDDATNLDLAANPASDEMAFASIGNAGSDLQVGYWSGVGWTNTANADITSATPLAGTKLVSVGWLRSGATTRSVVVYNDSATTNIGWRVGNRGASAAQTDFTVTPVFGNPQKWYNIKMDPKNPDRLMFLISDVNNDFFAKQLVMTSTPAFTWSNTEGGAALENSMKQSTAGPYSFTYWRQ